MPMMIPGKFMMKMYFFQIPPVVIVLNIYPKVLALKV